MKACKTERVPVDNEKQRKVDLKKTYQGSVSSYKHSRPTRKVVKRTFRNA